MLRLWVHGCGRTDWWSTTVVRSRCCDGASRCGGGVIGGWRPALVLGGGVPVGHLTNDGRRTAHTPAPGAAERRRTDRLRRRPGTAAVTWRRGTVIWRDRR